MVQVPLLALKMSTVLTATVAPAQGINQRRQQTKTLSLATMPLINTPILAINDFNTCYVLEPPANIASPSFGSDVAERAYRATLRAAVVHISLVALKMSTVLTGAPAASAQGISNQLWQQKQPVSLARMPPIHTTPPAINFNTCYAPRPPVNIASPSFGSDVAARNHRATLRAAVVHIPLLVLKTSTVLPDRPTPPVKGISY